MQDSKNNKKRYITLRRYNSHTSILTCRTPNPRREKRTLTLLCSVLTNPGAAAAVAPRKKKSVLYTTVINQKKEKLTKIKIELVAGRPADNVTLHNTEVLALLHLLLLHIIQPASSCHSTALQRFTARRSTAGCRAGGARAAQPC